MSSTFSYVPTRPTRSMAGMVAIVTGAGSLGTGIGNGRAAAILLAEAGARVLCVDMDLDASEGTVGMIKDEARRITKGREEASEGDEEGGKVAVAMQADVTKETDCAAVVQRAVDEWGRLDILVNNVGIGGARGTAVEVDVTEWNRGLEVNVTSMMLMVKYAVPVMLRNEVDGDGNGMVGRSWRGSVVNLGSVAGLKGGTPHLLYPTAKGAVVNMTRAMAAHHAPDGIRVNCVCPGMLYTPMMYGPGMSDDAREARKNRSLLKTEGNGWDCGAAVRFLAGDEARWITGIMLPVDAGVTAAVGTDLPKTASVGAGT